MPTPKDKKLYEEVKREVNKSYKKPSAYRSGAYVKLYLQKFRKKYGMKENPYLEEKEKLPPLKRWFLEDWKSDTNKYKYTSKSSVYRPTKRITRDTPLTFNELSKKEIKKAKQEKAKKGRVKRFRK